MIDMPTNATAAHDVEAGVIASILALLAVNAVLPAILGFLLFNLPLGLSYETIFFSFVGLILFLNATMARSFHQAMGLFFFTAALNLLSTAYFGTLAFMTSAHLWLEVAQQSMLS